MRNLFWPKTGWTRTLAYFRHRMSRISDTPHRIAAGIACGAAISFTPFYGFHILLACLLCLVVRGNFVAAAIGTAVGNPWTFLVIVPAIYETGLWFLGWSPESGVGQTSIVDGFWDAPGATIHDIILPMAIGGLPYAVVTWWVSYWITLRVVREYQKRRARRLERAGLAYGRRRGDVQVSAGHKRDRNEMDRNSPQG